MALAQSLAGAMKSVALCMLSYAYDFHGSVSEKNELICISFPQETKGLNK